ncbi:hypothetical protein B0T21DRAFT_353670 [Apiosordaria backusii]|uniref:Uncharacterized protein n=1 Tax=Apiosordaria backusii TaxID=314023 RepID=A0AA39ZQ49_9PEZI|nr:hypothetical protein B0T21DRAFT_353670 [Apiosordaria backusii]
MPKARGELDKFSCLPDELQQMIWEEAIKQKPTTPSAHIFSMTFHWSTPLPPPPASALAPANGLCTIEGITHNAPKGSLSPEAEGHLPYWSTHCLPTNSQASFSRCQVDASVQDTCFSAKDVFNRLDRLKHWSHISPSDPEWIELTQHSPSKSPPRRLHINRKRDLVVLTGDARPSHVSDYADWALGVPFAAAADRNMRVRHLAIEFDSAWLEENPDWDWGPKEFHGYYNCNVKQALCIAKEHFPEFWLIDRSLKRVPGSTLPRNRHIFHAKGGRFVEVRKAKDGAQYRYVKAQARGEGEWPGKIVKELVHPGAWQYQDGKPLDDFRRANAFDFKDELSFIDKSGMVWRENSLHFLSIRKYIDRDACDYDENWENVPSSELAAATGGFARLGVLAWEDGDFSQD